MIFLVLSVVSGFALAVLPIFAARKLRARWKSPKGLFIKAGVAALAVEIIHAAVLANGASIWPQVFDLPIYLTALLLGAISGLFIELGRFLVLDRIMKKIREFPTGVIFGLGWGGVQAVFYGIVVIIGAIGMFAISGVTDIAALVPDAGEEELAAFTEIKSQSEELMSGNPLLGLSPVLERAALISIDIALTLLIIMGLFLGRTTYIWQAVGLRALITASVIYFNSIHILLGLALLAVYGTAALMMIRRFADDFASLRGGKGHSGKGHSAGAT